MKILPTVGWTSIAMIAFAANSLLSRAALSDASIDPASFVTIRVVSGAIVLAVIMWPHWRHTKRRKVDWRAVASLFIYMVFFSFAYLSLSAGTGALILFAAVQLTMFMAALRAGERFSAWSWGGFTAAVLGLTYLVLPGIAAPNPAGAVLMTIAGIAWGLYSLYGKQAPDAREATANNFIFAVPFALLLSVLFSGQFQISWQGLLLAMTSGAFASGLGYVIWYVALQSLAATHAATVQLSVPVIAAIGGVILLAEPLSVRLAIAAIVTLGGVATVLSQRPRSADTKPANELR